MRSRKRTTVLYFVTAGVLCALLAEGVRWRRDPSSYQPQEGDVVFQADVSGRALMIQLATVCAFNHVGVVVRESDRFLVAEAARGVVRTPLQAFLARGGTHGRIAVLRYPSLTPEQTKGIVGELTRLSGKPYDYGLSWSDEQLYCSELVWKAFERGAHLELAPPVPLQSRHWARVVSSFVPSRFRVGRDHLREVSVTPADLFRSGTMRMVFRNI